MPNKKNQKKHSDQPRLCPFKRYYIALVLTGIVLFSGTFLSIGCGIKNRLNIQSARVEAAEDINPAEDIAVRFLRDYDEALDLAKRESKPVLLFFTLPNSTISDEMLKTTFQSREIRRLSRQFVCVQLDGVLDVELCRQRNVKGFPTILITNPQGRELKRLSGRQTPEDLAIQMHVVLQSTAARANFAIR